MTTVNSITQTQTIGVMPDNWSQILSFGQFDPSLGALVGLTITIDGTIAGSVSVQNLAPIAQTATVALSGWFQVFGPDGGLLDSLGFNSAEDIASAALTLSTLPGGVDPTATVNLGAYDGTSGFAGPAGAVVSGLSASASEANSSGPDAEAAGFVGSGTVPLTANSYGEALISGDPNLLAQSQVNGEASVSLTYDYIPAAQSGSMGGYGMFMVVGTIGEAILPLPSFPDDAKISAPQIVTMPSVPTGSTSLIPVSRFDPSLGTLDCVLFDIQIATSGTARAENLGATPSGFAVSESATVAVLSPTGGTVNGSPARDSWHSDLDLGNGFASSWYNLGAYDGVTDFAGASGSVVAITPVLNSHGFQDLATASGLAAFTGTGTIEVPVATSGNVSVQGPAQALTQTTFDTGATITVRYVYTPSTTTISGSAGVEGEPAFTPASNSTTAGSGRFDFAAGGNVPAPGAAAQSFNAPRMAFLGGAMGDADHVTARPNEDFVVGAGAATRIADFSVAAGDKLDISALLNGADLSNLGSFVGVSIDTSGSSIDTVLSVHGPGGSAALTLTNAGALSVADLLTANALIVAAH